MSTKLDEKGQFYFDSVSETGRIAIGSDEYSEIGRFIPYSIDAVVAALIVAFEIVVIQKIISVLQSTAGVTQFTGTRIAGAYAATIRDYSLPSVTARIIPSPGRMVSEAFMDQLNVAIEIRMPAVGKNAYTWDDMMVCYDAIVGALHRTGLWDSVIGIQVNQMTNVGSTQQAVAEDGVMVLASEWRITGDVV